MDDTCASYCETPAVRCPKPHKHESVFCDIHSVQHLAKYVKYKKLEANLHEVRDGQSADYYLKLYAKISHAYKVRFDFRESAIAHSARDIGHQIRLDWLWAQSTLCVQHLETIFQANPIQGGNLPPKQSVSQAERVQARKVFKTYTATKKRVEDYESLIKKAVESDIQNVESDLQQYVDNIRKRFGENAPTVDQLVRLGIFLVTYLSICMCDIRYTGYQHTAMVRSFEAQDTKGRILSGKLAYRCMMGHPSWYRDADLSVEDTEVVPDERLINHFNVLVDFIRLIDRKGLIFFLSSPFLRTIYNECLCVNIISYRCTALLVVNDGLLEMRHPGIHFTDEQLAMFDYSQFVESNGNLNQLITWRANSIHPSPFDKGSLTHQSPLYDAALITEYYTQALVLKLSVNDRMDVKEFNDIVYTIFDQMDALTAHFAFPKIVKVVGKYYESGRFRQNFHDIVAMLK